MDNVYVCKFGGSSTACYDDVERKREIVNEDLRRKIIVVSAHGKADGLDKDTNLLINMANNSDSSKVNLIIGKARKIYPRIEDQFFSELERTLIGRIENKSLEPSEYSASIRAFGEELCAKLHARTLGWEYVDPSELFVFEGKFDDAQISPISTKMIKERLKGDKIFVVPGYFGYTREGLISTLGRGGSDLTGSYIAASLDAKIYENFTDTAGIAAASPKIVSDAKIIEVMTYDELRSLAYSGFSVFYKEAMVPVAEKGIPIHVRGTFDYPSDGTMIVRDRIIENGETFIGVAYKPGLTSVEVDCFGLNDEIGIVEKILRPFNDMRISVEYLTTGIDDLSIIFRKDQCKNEDVLLDRIKYFVPNGSVSIQNHLGAVVVAGKGLKNNWGIAAKIQECLTESSVNLRFISKGPNERCIVYGVEESNGEKAVRALYDRFLR